MSVTRQGMNEAPQLARGPARLQPLAANETGAGPFLSPARLWVSTQKYATDQKGQSIGLEMLSGNVDGTSHVARVAIAIGSLVYEPLTRVLR